MKKISKKDKRRISFFCILLIILVAILIGIVFKDWLQIIDNKKQVLILQKRYSSLLSDENSLESEVNKLQDPEYVARYAREKYLLSKEGEIIIRIPLAKDK